MNINVQKQPIYNNPTIAQNFSKPQALQQPSQRRILHLEKGRRNFLRDSSRRKKSSSFPRTSLPPVSEEGGVSNALATPRSSTFSGAIFEGPEKVIVRATVLEPCVAKRVDATDGNTIPDEPVARNNNEQDNYSSPEENDEEPFVTPVSKGRLVNTMHKKFSQLNMVNGANEQLSPRDELDDYLNSNISHLMPRNTYMRSQSLPRNPISQQYHATSNNLHCFDNINKNGLRQPRPLVKSKPISTTFTHAENGIQKPCNMFTKLTGIIEPKYKPTIDSKSDVLKEMNAAKVSAMNQTYSNTLYRLQTGTLLQNNKQMNSQWNYQPSFTVINDNTNGVNGNTSRINKTCDKESVSIFSERYTKVLSSSEMNARKEWAEIQKRKAKMREDFFRVPYEECNREAMMGQLGKRFSKSEPRLNTLKSEIKKNQSILRENSRRESAPIWKTSARAVSPEISRMSIHTHNVNSAKNQTKPVNKPCNATTAANDTHADNEDNSNNIFLSERIPGTSEQLMFQRPINSNSNITTQLNQKPVPLPRRRKSVPGIVSPALIDRNHSQKTINYVSRRETADVHMTCDPSYSRHHISLTTHVSQCGPNVTVTRYKVPAIPYRDQWEWSQKYCRDITPIASERNAQHINYCATSDYTSNKANLLSEVTSPLSSPDDSCYSQREEGIHSPTPSSGYESCTNANSPTPPPQALPQPLTPISNYSSHDYSSDQGSSASTRNGDHYIPSDGCVQDLNEYFPRSPDSPSQDTTFNHSSYLTSTTVDDSVYVPNTSTDVQEYHLVHSPLEGSDWSAVSCRSTRKASDCSSTSSSSGCYSGASSPTPLVNHLTTAPSTRAPQRQLPTAL